MNNRRSFLLLSGTTIATSLKLAGTGIAQEALEQEIGKQRLPSELVKEFVGSAHTNLQQTKKMLVNEPRLIRANYEWSPGDFESAIDGAAHSGSIDIVKLLLNQGASYSIFVAAVLGHLDAIKAAIEHQPALVKSRGPHGIGLLQHALAGGKTASKVVEFLKEKGADPDEEWLDLKYDNDVADFVTGDYEISRGGRTIEFSIQFDKDKLYILAGARPRKRLQYQGDTRFAVEGTPAELHFERESKTQKKCKRILMKEGFPVGFASRKDK